MIIETFSREETRELGRRLGEQAAAGSVYCLIGDLETGKSVFTQGFAAGLGVEGPVNSPTFTIVQEYMGSRMPFYHFDEYRLEGPEEMEEIGYEEYVFGEGVCLIEWADRILEILPERRVEIRIEKDPGKGFDYRRIDIDQHE